ncbi:MAG TPA: PIG-L family deacetylase [Steroidobacteraceae bacterium]|nr:PIG-L family deacetylase [Steroidobacteraceae bacterium]
MRSLILSSTLTIAALAGNVTVPADETRDYPAPATHTVPRAARRASADAPPTAELPPISRATSLLVVAPHPDDESLCCAGIIQRVIQVGGRVSVVWITSGDASEIDRLVIEKRVFGSTGKMRDLGERRMHEAQDAATILGLAPEHLYFLGYPDRGVLALATDNYVTPYRSRFTGAASVPYRAALFPGHPYTGQSLEEDFTTVLERTQPTLILAPSPRDSHPDHRATGIITIRVLSHRHELTRARYWIVHGGEDWPRPKGFEPGLALTPAPLDAGLSPAPFPLDSGEEQRKLFAIRAYHTQMKVTSTNLLSFVRRNELFSSRPVPQEAPSD